MCRQGDVEIIPNWRSHKSIADLKRMVEERGYSAFTISSGEPSFGHAALKSFKYQLTPEHCKHISSCCNHPCTIWIYHPDGDEQGDGEAPPRCSTGVCGFAVNQDPEYRRNKPVEDHAYCCTACRYSNGAMHGGWCQRISTTTSTTAHGDQSWPQPIRLTLSSHPGEAIIAKWGHPKNAWGQWDYIDLGVGPAEAAISVSYDGQFLARNEDPKLGEMVFDVSMWDFRENNHLVLVKVAPGHASQDATRKHGGGRDFCVNSDGTVSPKPAGGFVLGKRGDGSLVLVPKGSPDACVLEGVGGSIFFSKLCFRSAVFLKTTRSLFFLLFSGELGFRGCM